MRTPKTLTLAVTNGCNLNCNHCLLDCRSLREASNVPAQTLKRLVREFAEIGGESICLAGGEPLTHPQWFELISFCTEQPEFNEVIIQTNGTQMTETEVKALVSLKSKKLCIQVSLDGAQEETNDRVRGAGSFKKAIKSLHLLTKAGLGKQTLIAFTEMEHNFGDLPQLLGLVKELNLRKLVSGTLVMGGRAKRSSQLSQPTPSQYRELLRRYRDDSQFRENYKKFGNIAALEWYEGRYNPAEQVCVCIENPMISAEGMMYPCKMLLVDEFAIDGLHDHPLSDSMIKALPLWAKLPEISQRRRAELSSCKKCPGEQHCGGGCMGRAYAGTGHLMTCEDRCALRRAVYEWENEDSL